MLVFIYSTFRNFKDQIYRSKLPIYETVRFFSSLMEIKVCTDVSNISLTSVVWTGCVFALITDPSLELFIWNTSKPDLPYEHNSKDMFVSSKFFDTKQYLSEQHFRFSTQANENWKIISLICPAKSAIHFCEFIVATVVFGTARPLPEKRFDFFTQSCENWKTFINFSFICPTDSFLHFNGFLYRSVEDFDMSQHHAENKWVLLTPTR